MTIVIETFVSKILEGNPLGDTPERRIPVYLPPGYDPQHDVGYPLVFALPAFTGTGLSFLNYDFYRPNLPAMLEALIESGEMAPCVVVMVDSMTALGGNQFIDSPAVGSWATHVCEELVPWAEARFRCRRGRDHRGVFGQSSGGYGALMMGMSHPETFAAVACHSGDMGFEYALMPDIPRAVDSIRRMGGLSNWLEGWRKLDRLPAWAFSAVSVVAMSAFYSPRAEAPHGFDLPFDEETGAFRRDVFDRWLKHDPVRQVARCREAIASLRLLYFDCGDQDEYNLHHGARLLGHTLETHGLPHVYERFDGGHRGVSHRFKESLPRLVRALMG